VSERVGEFVLQCPPPDGAARPLLKGEAVLVNDSAPLWYAGELVGIVYFCYSLPEVVVAMYPKFAHLVDEAVSLLNDNLESIPAPWFFGFRSW
jgi:hypothetical protein